MALHAYWDNNSNFGDKLTPWLINKINGQYPIYCSLNKNIDKYLVTGSILTARNHNYNMVWGCGIAFNNEKVIIPKQKEIYSVRGPISKELCIRDGAAGHDLVFGDPGLLINKYYNPKVTKKYEVGVIASWVDYRLLNTYKNIHLIPTMKVPVEETIDQLLSCKRVYSSCLHGLIACVSYGIPTRCVQFGTRLVGDGTKFHDFLLSIEEDPLIENIENEIQLFKTKTRIHNRISNDDLLASCPFKQ